MSINTYTLQATTTAQNTATTQSSNTTTPFWGDDGLTFADLVDIINPLQHIPIVSNLYQSHTGDEQSNGAKIMGGALYGGFIGLLSSFFDSALEQETGKNISQTALAFFSPPTKNDVTSPTQLAENTLDDTTKEQIRNVLHYAAKQEASTADLSADEATEILADIKTNAVNSVNALLAQANRPTLSEEHLKFLKEDWELKEILDIVNHPTTQNEPEFLAEELAFIQATEKYQQGATYTGGTLYNSTG